MGKPIAGTLSNAEQWEAFAEELRDQARETDARPVYYALERSARAAECVAARIRRQPFADPTPESGKQGGGDG